MKDCLLKYIDNNTYSSEISDLEKLVKIVDYMLRNFEYDVEKRRQALNGEIEYVDGDLENLLKTGKGVCGDFSYLACILGVANNVSIYEAEAEFGSEFTHSINLTILNGRCYLLDISSMIQTKMGIKRQKNPYDYFLLSYSDLMHLFKENGIDLSLYAIDPVIQKTVEEEYTHLCNPDREFYEIETKSLIYNYPRNIIDDLQGNITPDTETFGTKGY